MVIRYADSSPEEQPGRYFWLLGLIFEVISQQSSSIIVMRPLSILLTVLKPEIYVTDDNLALSDKNRKTTDQISLSPAHRLPSSTALVLMEDCFYYHLYEVSVSMLVSICICCKFVSTINCLYKVYKKKSHKK